MNDYLGHEPISDQVESSLGEDPQFGLIDVIEAFTAMRQEWRGQSRETRAMAQTLEASRDDLFQLEQRLAGSLAKIQAVAAEATSDETSRRLAESIAEIDQHVLRAVNATSRTNLMNQLQLDAESLQAEIAATAQQLGFIRQWFCRPALKQVELVISRWVQSQTSRTDDASQRGLQMLVDRVQRLMQDQQIQRIETLGKLFDAETMNAIEAVSTSTAPTGSVVEQLSPGYTWCGRLIRYAQVRIAR